MRGAAVPSEDRPTVLDPADPRIPTVYPPRLSPEKIRALTRQGATDPRLRGVDRCFQRWSVTPTSVREAPRIASIVFLGAHASAPVALPDRESHLMDLAVRNSPQWAREFVILWYRSERTSQEIADLLGMKRRQAVYEERHVVLSYYLGRLTQMGLQVVSWDGDS